MSGSHSRRHQPHCGSLWTLLGNSGFPPPLTPASLLKRTHRLCAAHAQQNIGAAVTGVRSPGVTLERRAAKNGSVASICLTLRVAAGHGIGAEATRDMRLQQAHAELT